MAIKRALRFTLGLSWAALMGLVWVGIARPAAAGAPFSMSGQHRHWCCSKVALPGGVLPTPTFPPGTFTATGNYEPFPQGGVIFTQPNPGLLYGASAYGVDFGGIVSQTGLPMTSMNPATLTLPTGAFAYTNHYTGSYFESAASLSNARATFMAGAGPGTVSGGPGSYSFCRAATGTPPGVTPCTAPPGVGGVGDPNFPWQIRIQAGRNRFGGTIALLGRVSKFVKVKHSSLGAVFFNHYWSYSPIEGQAIPAINRSTVLTRFTLSGAPVSLPVSYGYATYRIQMLYQSGAPLTTGTISVKATAVSYPFLYLQAQVHGYDDRTANGQGNIQLVTPVVGTTISASQAFPKAVRYTMALPEPGSALALGPGIAALIGLERLRRRRVLR